jgi:hypothetical protein
MYQTKDGNVYFFTSSFANFCRFDDFWRIFLKTFFVYIFWLASECWPFLYFFCHPFCIFESCLDSNPESCRGTQEHYQLSYQSLYQLSHSSQPIATHLMSCLRPYCAVGVPNVANNVHSFSVGLPSAIDVCDVPIVSAAVAGVPAECCCLHYC